MVRVSAKPKRGRTISGFIQDQNKFRTSVINHSLSVPVGETERGRGEVYLTRLYSYHPVHRRGDQVSSCRRVEE